MRRDPITLAARNNGLWCDTMCRAWGSGGELRSEVWFTRFAPPPFYPNVVTLMKEEGLSAQLTIIKELVESNLTGEWGVKDSFALLDLEPLGFRSLFEAQWIYLPSSRLMSRVSPMPVQWKVLESDSELCLFEVAWGGHPTDRLPMDSERLFRPNLLSAADIAILAAYEGSRIIAGAIANRTGEVVGLSNLFTPKDEPERYWAECVNVVAALYPAHDLVGYERDQELEHAQAVGFSAIGPLRVWQKRLADNDS